MKKLIKETTIRNKKGHPVKVITYGYNTKIPSLDVIRLDGVEKDFAIIHRKSGFGMGLFNKFFTKLIKIANENLGHIDFTRDSADLAKDKDFTRLCAKIRKELGGENDKNNKHIHE